MSKKETKLEDFDFGFSTVNEDDIPSKHEAEIDKWYTKAHDVYDTIEVFLDNLTKDRKDYIHWPWNVREQKIAQFKKKLKEILNA